MLHLIGLGLSWKDISLKALEALNKCDEVYLETYTSVADFSVRQLERLLGKKIKPLNRKQTEEEQPFFKEAALKDIALLVYGDPLSATTHLQILQEARKRKIKAEVIHAPSILTAVAETGLQLYKFGKVASIPIPEKNFHPESFFQVLKDNQRVNAHTLFLLDLKPEQNKFLTVPQAINIITKIAKKRKDSTFNENTLCIACSQLGMPNKSIRVAPAKELKDFKGKPPYCLIVPSKLHFTEKLALGL